MGLTLLLLGAVLISQAAAACSDPAAIEAFDEDRILGTWYNVKQTEFNWPGSSNSKCPYNIYSRSSDGDLDGNIWFYNTTSSSYHKITIHMHKETPGSSSGKYVVHREGRHDSRNSKAYFVSTDYDNYAVTWMCGYKPGTDETYELFFVITRQKNPSDSVKEAADASLPQTASYTPSDQTDCPENNN